jgi:hypothetical protein
MLTSVLAIAGAAALSLAASPRMARAQAAVLLQGIADVEGWATDTTSNLLTRNGGKPGLMGRLVLWGAVEPVPSVVFFTSLGIEAGRARDESEKFGYYTYQAGLRLTPARWFVVDAGRMPHPVGAFAPRRFSNRNPLIGVPDGYPLIYPEGVQVSGTAMHLDWRVAVVDLPLSHEGYTPNPSRAWRPAVGGGITLMTGVRIGASGTWGAYLSDSIAPGLLAGQAWQSFHQRVAALDAQVSHDDFELRGEWAHGAYDVPGLAAVSGETWYAEGRMTLSPRWFAAGRVEHNAYPFIAAFGPVWTASVTTFNDVELGIGYRFSASLLAKVSWRADRWQRTPSQYAFIGPGGRAFAVQVSQSFDVLDWFAP